MDRTREDLLRELEAHGRLHDAALEDRLTRLRNVERDTAQLMAVLIRAMRATRVLELGTSNGYAAIWLADAAEEHGGRLLSVDVDAGRHAEAVTNVQRAALGSAVELRLEDAAETLAALPDGAADFIFLDAEREAYVAYWPDLLRVLDAPGLLVVDNAISHAGELAEFSALVDGDGRAALALAPVGAGALLVSRTAQL